MLCHCYCIAHCRVLQHALPKSVQNALLPKCHSGVSQNEVFVTSYVSTIISKSVDALTNNTTGHIDDMQLAVQCYIEAILDGAVKKVEEDTETTQHNKSVDLYFIIHTRPIPSPCQKFKCDNTDEINLVYHCWLFKDVPYDLEEIFTDQLSMGVFEPHGVQPVHQNLLDAGVEFGGISERQETDFFVTTIAYTCSLQNCMYTWWKVFTRKCPNAAPT